MEDEEQPVTREGWARLEQLEHRVQQLEHQIAAGEQATTDSSECSGEGAPSASGTANAGAGRQAPSGTDSRDPMWILKGMRERHPETDVVSLAGEAHPGGSPISWQWSRPTEFLLERDFADAAKRLSPLSHPVRLALLQAILKGTDSATQLAKLDGVGTSGQVYHHINQLAAGGWLRSTRRGHWQVPGERIIPLFAIIMAATE